MIKCFMLLFVIAMLAGCSSATSTPDPNGPILTGFNALPKSLATVQLSPTPNAPQAQATLDNRRPTNTLPPPTFTPTPTPVVGIFMGASTFSAGSLLPIGTRPVAIVTFVPGPGTRVANNPPPVSSGGGVAGNCTTPAAPQFANVARNAAVAQKLGCPTGNPYVVKMVVQTFQNGFMFWRDTKEIYVLSTAALRTGATTDTFWRVADNWNDSIPANDPSQVPPAGLLQPVRGFGYVWRTNTAFRTALGWALAGEQPFDSTWQNFEHGWMMTSNNGAALALAPLDGPPPTTGIHFGPLS
ncbi:MAG: hypothetical protein ABI947_16645 [Chloroflexota bacterium]